MDPDGQRWRGGHPVGSRCCGQHGRGEWPGFKAGTYALSESGPTDYTNGGYSCSKNGGAYADATSITLGLGDSAICKITNDDKRHS